VKFIGGWRSKLGKANEALATAHKLWRDERLDQREQHAEARESTLARREVTLAKQLAELRAIENRRWRRRLGLLVVAIATGILGYILGTALASTPATGPHPLGAERLADAAPSRKPVTSAPSSEAATAVTKEPDTSAREYPAAKQYLWIDASKEAIKAQLKDGASAEFKDVAFYSGGGVPVTCGEVNAKNGFGGYRGFERFIAAGADMAVLQSQSSDGIGPAWDKFCTHGPQDKAHTD
jgi:hypothetical protein